MRKRLGLPTRAERTCAMAGIAATGGWLAAATAAGEAHGPLPRVLLVARLVLAVPWWAHRRRRAKVRVERLLAAWPEIAPAVGLTGSWVISAVVDLLGWRVRFALARGQSIIDVIAKLPAIESGLGTFRCAARVYPTPDDLANRFELRVLNQDPDADAITWPGPSVATLESAWPVDLFRPGRSRAADRHPTRLSTPRPAGAPGTAGLSAHPGAPRARRPPAGRRAAPWT